MKNRFAMAAFALVCACSPRGGSNQSPGVALTDASTSAPNSAASGTALGKDQAATLIFNAVKNTCDSVSAGADGISPSQKDQFEIWTKNLLRTSPIMHVVHQEIIPPYKNLAGQSFEGGESGKYTYNLDNINWNIEYYIRFDESYNGTYDIRFDLCWVVPKSVTIEDITPDSGNPKRATVTYLLNKQMTPVSTVVQQEISSITPNGLPQGLAPNPQEGRMVLERLDATGWRVAQ